MVIIPKHKRDEGSEDWFMVESLPQRARECSWDRKENSMAKIVGT